LGLERLPLLINKIYLILPNHRSGNLRLDKSPTKICSTESVLRSSG
jgi:hypothetical protein